MPTTRSIYRASQAATQEDVASTSSSNAPLGDKDQVLARLQSLLKAKAPEGLPLLQQLLDLLRQDPREIVEAEKRTRSIVIAGVAEAEPRCSPIERQTHTEEATVKILSALGVEARPTEVYRMGLFTEGKKRLIKCVLPSERFFIQALRNAPTLRSITGFDQIYVRKSMTRAEREQDRALRERAREINLREHNGSKVYVVYRNQVVKRSDIPTIKANLSKNH